MSNPPSLRLASALIKTVRICPPEAVLSQLPSPLPYNVLLELNKAMSFAPLLNLEDGRYLVARHILENLNSGKSSSILKGNHSPPNLLPPPSSEKIPSSKLPASALLPGSIIEENSFALASLLPSSPSSTTHFHTALSTPTSLPPTNNFNAHSKVRDARAQWFQTLNSLSQPFSSISLCSSPP